MSKEKYLFDRLQKTEISQEIARDCINPFKHSETRTIHLGFSRILEKVNERDIKVIIWRLKVILLSFQVYWKSNSKTRTNQKHQKQIRSYFFIHSLYSQNLLITYLFDWWKFGLQLAKKGYTPLLHKPYWNEVTLTDHNLY